MTSVNTQKILKTINSNDLCKIFIYRCRRAVIENSKYDWLFEEQVGFCVFF